MPSKLTGTKRCVCMPKPPRTTILNQRGYRTWEGNAFNLKKIAYIRGAYNLPSRYDRLRRRGMLTTREVADRFAVSDKAIL